ncbi:MAG: DUF1294 domain-containing protein [Planctomycetota bacterium]|jgi:uncharacterized membrane protein YsdA (DUF1294 family)
MPRHNPEKFYLIIAAILIAAVSAVFWRMRWNPLYSCLIGVNAVVFLFYGFDKQQAIAQRQRIPELVLHGLALLGGTPGAFLGQILFRHKTQKLKFKITFAAIVILQIVLVFCYWRFFLRGR